MGVKGLFVSESEFREFAASGDLTYELATRAAMGLGDWYGLGEILPNPDKILREFGNSIDTYREVMKESKVGSDIRSRKAGTMALKYRIVQGEADDESTAVVTAIFKKLRMRKIISEILNAPFFGYQPLEIYWSMKYGYFWVDGFVAKPSEWFRFNVRNELLLMTYDRPEGMLVTPDGLGISVRKFIVAGHETSFMNPYGEPILSECFWPVKIKKRGWGWWVQYIENFGTPILDLEYSPDPDPIKNAAKVAELQRRAVAMARSGIIIRPKGQGSANILTGASGSNGGHHREMVKECDAQIGNVILGHNGNSESTSGKLGGEDAAIIVRADIIDSDKDLCETVFNELIDAICDANWPGMTKRPRLELYRPGKANLNLATIGKTLTEQGVRLNKKWYASNLDLPEDQFELVDPQPLSGGVPPSGAEV